MADCKNPTCDRPSTSTYCSRLCQIAMRTATKGRQLNDTWVSMATWYRLSARADELGITVRDLMMNLIEAEVGIDE